MSMATYDGEREYKRAVDGVQQLGQIDRVELRLTARFLHQLNADLVLVHAAVLDSHRALNDKQRHNSCSSTAVSYRCGQLMYRRIGRYRRSKSRKPLTALNTARHLLYVHFRLRTAH